MNKDIMQGEWKQFKGSVQAKWGDLTDDVFDQIDGNREKLVGKIQEMYGKSKEQAEEEVNQWESEQNI